MGDIHELQVYLLESLVKAKLWVTVEQFVSNLKHAEARQFFLVHLVRGLILHGEMERATHIVSRITNVEKQAQLYQEISIALSEYGDIDAAIKYVRLIENEENKFKGMGAVIDNLNEVSQRKIDAVIDESSQIVSHSIESLSPKVADALARNNRLPEALSTLSNELLPDGFFEVLITWATHLESHHSGLYWDSIQETSAIFGWYYPEWRKLNSLISAN